MTNSVKWIIFDVSGVIVNLTLQNPHGYEVRSRYFTRENLEGIFSTKEYHDYALGVLSHEQCISKFIEHKKLDLSVSEFNELFKNDITPMVGMKELIEQLSHVYQIALATNEGKENVKHKIEGSHVLPYLSKVIASYRIRELKPSIAFYKKMLGIIQAKPSECVFVDDTPANVQVASSMGMRGIVFTNTPQLEKELHALQLL